MKEKKNLAANKTQGNGNERNTATCTTVRMPEKYSNQPENAKIDGVSIHWEDTKYWLENTRSWQKICQRAIGSIRCIVVVKGSYIVRQRDENHTLLKSFYPKTPSYP